MQILWLDQTFELRDCWTVPPIFSPILKASSLFWVCCPYQIRDTKSRITEHWLQLPSLIFITTNNHTKFQAPRGHWFLFGVLVYFLQNYLRLHQTSTDLVVCYDRNPYKYTLAKKVVWFFSLKNSLNFLKKKGKKCIFSILFKRMITLILEILESVALIFYNFDILKSKRDGGFSSFNIIGFVIYKDEFWYSKY